ncbi:MAG: 2OG-Fe(II) oxygenase [Acidimicrobiales bacterium]|nr:2OG-Fe(II) oxygenase [Acidimicrobiales bacterium]
MTLGAEDVVDLDRYPVLDLAGPAATAVVDQARAQLARTGAVELEGFVTAPGVAALVADAEELAPRAHHSEGVGTAYLEVPDFSLPDTHPRLTWARYAVGAVAYDLMPETSLLRRLYEWDPLLGLVAAILDRGPLYRYADPFGALNLAVMGEGDELQWHFDQSDFVVSLAIQASTQGGDFEVFPKIRSADDERYDRVAAALSGDRAGMTTLPMRPGTLLVFEGRHSLHRVSPIVGPTLRHVGLLAYDTAPDTTGSDLLRESRYGRTVPYETPPLTWPAS